jgi:hypothetical protein
MPTYNRSKHKDSKFFNPKRVESADSKRATPNTVGNIVPAKRGRKKKAVGYWSDALQG